MLELERMGVLASLLYRFFVRKAEFIKRKRAPRNLVDFSDINVE